MTLLSKINGDFLSQIPSQAKCHDVKFKKKTILSHANGSITQTRRDNTMPCLSCDYKNLRSEVPKSSEYLLGDDLNQRLKPITKKLKP